jgi:hypothetical protein
MNAPAAQYDELGHLLAALCDGELMPDEAARLERLVAGSDDARRYFLQYVQLNGELCWAFTSSVALPHEPGLPAAGDFPAAAPASHGWRPKRLLRGLFGRLSRSTAASLLLTTLAAGSLVVVLALSLARFVLQGEIETPASRTIARLIRTVDAEFSGTGAPMRDGDELALGVRLELRKGLAEVVYDHGAQVIIESPATYEITSADGGFLHVGNLHATVPSQAVGFTVDTPNASVVDRGTEFGLSVDQAGQGEVYVFAGSIEIMPRSDGAADGTAHRVHAGQAVRVWAPAAGAAVKVEAVGPNGRRFVRVMPAAESPPGGISALRGLVAAHPRLLHHYTFEGTTPYERRQDKRSALHLIEAVMSGGRAGGELEFVASPLESAGTAVRPYRGPTLGNSAGIGLQSDGIFQPPAAMTVELLANFAGFAVTREGAIGAAVATRASAERCGFLVAAVDAGQIVFLLDRDAPWGGSETPLFAGEWYYLVSTFQVQAGRTRVNTYLADLSRGEKTLTRVVRDEMAPGVPAASRLGIGKGFDSSVAHAYPWPGLLDEVAIYDAILDAATLQRHLDALTGGKSSVGERPR